MPRSRETVARDEVDGNQITREVSPRTKIAKGYSLLKRLHVIKEDQSARLPTKVARQHKKTGVISHFVVTPEDFRPDVFTTAREYTRGRIKKVQFSGPRGVVERIFQESTAQLRK